MNGGYYTSGKFRLHPRPARSLLTWPATARPRWRCEGRLRRDTQSARGGQECDGLLTFNYLETGAVCSAYTRPHSGHFSGTTCLETLNCFPRVNEYFVYNCRGPYWYTFVGPCGFTQDRGTVLFDQRSRRERRWTSARATPARELVRSTRQQSRPQRRQRGCRSFRWKGSLDDSASVQAVS